MSGEVLRADDLQAGFLYRAEPRDPHPCNPPTREVRYYAPLGPAGASRSLGAPKLCTCRGDTGEVDPECPSHGGVRERPFHSDWVPDGEPGTLWRCACGQPWRIVVKMVAMSNRGAYHGVRRWERTTERDVARALRRAQGRSWWRRCRKDR